MEVVEPQVIIEWPKTFAYVYERLESYGRVAYKSEDRITEGSAAKFLKGLIKSGHESVLEHESISVRFICDRGVTHELVRHRLAAYTQESTRYCNYSMLGMQFIKPVFWSKSNPLYLKWLTAMENAEHTYNFLIEHGATPQEARAMARGPGLLSAPHEQRRWDGEPRGRRRMPAPTDRGSPRSDRGAGSRETTGRGASQGAPR